MIIKKGQWPIAIALTLMLIIFGTIFIQRANYEFIIYLAVILVLFLLILFTNSKVNYPNYTLWGLLLWALLHLSGGGLSIKGQRLYELILIPISETYQIFRYDQFVHIIGFGVATLLVAHFLRQIINPPVKRKILYTIILVMGGLGIGALNEIVEFGATVIAPETGVGGYINTSMDLVSDLVGALIALIIIKIKDKSLFNSNKR
ncbi:MAG: DUF2238 domain-containing protein [Nanoarchaeota archaeon]